MKLWIVILQDKELYLEPDIGVTFVESDNEQDAIDAGVAMRESALSNGRYRCVARHRADVRADLESGSRRSP